MAARSMTDLRWGGHWPSFRRFVRGKTAMRPPRVVYGQVVTCECGWEEKVNGRKSDAVQRHNAHLREQLRQRGEA